MLKYPNGIGEGDIMSKQKTVFLDTNIISKLTQVENPYDFFFEMITSGVVICVSIYNLLELNKQKHILSKAIDLLDYSVTGLPYRVDEIVTFEVNKYPVHSRPDVVQLLFTPFSYDMEGNAFSFKDFAYTLLNDRFTCGMDENFQMIMELSLLPKYYDDCNAFSRRMFLAHLQALKLINKLGTDWLNEKTVDLFPGLKQCIFQYIGKLDQLIFQRNPMKLEMRL